MMCDCIFCKIANKQISANIIYENEKVFAILDINPASNGHILIISKDHYENLVACDDQTLADVLIVAKKLASKLLAIDSLNIKGFNYLINQNKIAGQEIEHFHLHLIPKYNQNEGFSACVKPTSNKLDLETVYKMIKE